MKTAPALAHCAVIGNPIAHSRSPQIHALFARQTGHTLQYDRLLAPLDGFTTTVADFAAAGGVGLNVTVPFKQQAYTLAAARLSHRARLAGAVNTLSWRDGVWHGCNTDGVGLVNDLHRLGQALAGTRVLLVGAGGAARGALQALTQAGCLHIHLVNRTVERAVTLVETWQQINDSAQTRITAGPLSAAATPGGWDLVINASASGLSNQAPDLPRNLYAAAALAYDMMYGAAPTAFMQQAMSDGALRVADGLGMLVAQAAESFFIWHGIRPACAPVLDLIRAELTALKP